MKTNPVLIKLQAQDELDEELRIQAVAEEKERILRRLKRPWWTRIFPFRIRIERIIE